MKQADAYKSLQLIYFALLAGQVCFIIAAIFLVHENIFAVAKPYLENIFMPLRVILALLCMVSGSKLFKTRIKKLVEINSVNEQFAEYHSISLVRWALLEGPCLFAIICFLLTANYLFLIIATLILFIFGNTSPVKSKVAADMGISPEELDSGF